MAKCVRQQLLFLLAAVAGLLAAPGVASAAPAWQKAPLPKIGNFEIALGDTTDLECWSENRCLLLTTGNSGFANGLFVYNGRGWRHYSSVCGTKSSEYGQIVWSGPTEFWTITQPSSPQDGSANVGLALCRFKDGQVVGSFSTKINGGGDDPAGDPFRRLNAGACISADNCWFGGAAAQSPDSSRVGSFHLHWDGADLSTVYAPAKRGVSSMVKFGGGLIETLLAGPDRNLPPNPDFGELPELSLLQEIDGGGSGASAITPVDFEPSPSSAVAGEVTELYASDEDTGGGPTSGAAWVAGGGATSGPGATPDDPFDRGPFIARATAGGIWQEIAIPPAMFSPDAQFVDIATMPGGDAMVAVLPDRLVGAMVGGPATVARVSAAGDFVLQEFGFNGTIAAIDCPAVDDCWAATDNGWIYHYSDPAAPVPNEDSNPAFTPPVTFRPNEVIEQAISDLPPEDDSMLFAPPPAEEETPAPTPKTKKLKPAIRSVRSKMRGTTLVLSFRVVRRARIVVVARRKRKVVARVSTKLLRKGRHSVRLRLNPRKWPTKLSMQVKEPGLSQPQDDKDTVSVPDEGVTEESSTVSASRCRFEKISVVCG